MTIEDLKKYKEKLSKLSDEEKKLRDIYLSKLAKGVFIASARALSGTKVTFL